MIIGALMLLQVMLDPVRPMNQAQLRIQAQQQAFQSGQKAEAERRARDFEQKMNRLVAALEDFATEYNQNRAQVLPLKRVQAIEKAYRDVQATEAWKLSKLSPPSHSK